MAKIKYIPAEIDDQNVFDRTERKLAAADVRRGEFDDDAQTITVEDTLVDHETRISDLEQAQSDPPNLDTILVSGVSWQVLVNFEGNVLTTGA